jgi:hypothetical protein
VKRTVTAVADRDEVPDVPCLRWIEPHGNDVVSVKTASANAARLAGVTIILVHPSGLLPSPAGNRRSLARDTTPPEVARGSRPSSANRLTMGGGDRSAGGVATSLVPSLTAARCFTRGKPQVVPGKPLSHGVVTAACLRGDLGHTPTRRALQA